MKKILFVFLFILCTYVHTEVVFADTYIVQLPELPEYDTEEYPYYYIKQWDESRYSLYLLTDNRVYYDDRGYYFGAYWSMSSYSVSEVAEENVWTSPSGYYNGYSHNTFICDSSYTQSADGTIIYSNFDIVYEGTLLLEKREFSTDGFEEVDDSPTLSGIGNFFSDLGSKLGNWFSNLISSISNLRDNIVNKLSEVIADITNTLADVISAIVGLPSTIVSGFQDLLEFLFVPSDNLFTELQEVIEQKFEVFFDLESLISEIASVNLYQGTPHFEITYKGKTYEIIDFSMFDDYRIYITSLSSFLMIFSTLMWLLKNAPNIIHGQSINSDTGLHNEYIGNFSATSSRSLNL